MIRGGYYRVALPQRKPRASGDDPHTGTSYVIWRW